MAISAPRNYVREARRRVAPKRERIGEIVERLARGASGRDDRAPLPGPGRAARLRHALRPDDGRDREPRHRRALPEVPSARGLPRRPAGRAGGRHPPDGHVPPEGEEPPRDDDDADHGVRRPCPGAARRARPAPRGRSQDGERRRRRAGSDPGDRRRHPRPPPVAAARPHEAAGPGEDRARPHARRPAGGLGPLPAPCSSGTAAGSAMRGAPAARSCVLAGLCPSSRV